MTLLTSVLLVLDLRAGAAQVDINPRTLPVVINCGFLERSANEVRSDLFARAIVLDDGRTRIALTVVDSCMMPRELIDRAKQTAAERTGIAVDRMMISATHTHSAPAAMACLGSRQQKDYADWLPGHISEVIAAANSRLEPARIGAASIDAPAHAFCRRWIYQPDRMLTDPFGERSVRANMIPGFENPDVISPSGPVDTELSLLAVQSAKTGKALAILANYGNHYFGSSGVSPDYFGLFDKGLAEKTGAAVVMVSQGTSGDANTNNYAKPKPTWTIDEYANGLIDLAYQAYGRIRYESGVPIHMAEARLELARRMPNSQRLAWSEEMVRKQQGEKPANQPEVYAHEQLYIRDTPTRELKLQAIRIGDIALTAIPNEVFAITGLKLKAQSPMPRTFNIELANGAEGYIPPPEQHMFGGYTTWAARTASLETGAEPRIVQTLLGMLESVSGRQRRVPRLPTPPKKALAYWSLDDFDYGTAHGSFPAKHQGRLALRLPGVTAASRAVYLAGGSIEADVADVSGDYTVQFEFWPAGSAAAGELLAINGATVLAALPDGTTPRAWHTLSAEQQGQRLRVSVDGKHAADMHAGAPLRSLRLGAGFEGKLDEVVVYPGPKRFSK